MTETTSSCNELDPNLNSNKNPVNTSHSPPETTSRSAVKAGEAAIKQQ